MAAQLPNTGRYVLRSSIRLQYPHDTVNSHGAVTVSEEPATATSDYGSDVDFDDDLIEQSIEETGNQSRGIVLAELLEGDQDVALQVNGVTVVPMVSGRDATRTRGSIYQSVFEQVVNSELLPHGLEESLYPTLSALLNGSLDPSAQITATVSTLNDLYNPSGQEPVRRLKSEPLLDAKGEPIPDTRSPLERFRSPPKKSLSVTDIVSPAWCEIQYEFNLATHGKKRATPAMKKGTVVHDKLEAEVHTFVPVVVKSKEEQWGLKFWNIIQGLRTLRETGMTRELVVFGVIDGLVIQGCIDEISNECPDIELEQSLHSKPIGKKSKGKTEAIDTAQQTTLGAYFEMPTAPESNDSQCKFYLSDTKTTGKKVVPPLSQQTSGRMQLMLYRQMLIAMASNEVPADAVFSRYKLDAHAPFSSEFIGEIAGLDAQFSPSQSEAMRGVAYFNTPEQSASEIQTYNTLNLLWSAMIQEFMATIPSPQSVGHVLNLTFRRNTDGSILEHQPFLHDDSVISSFITKEMAWWKGTRPAEGVDIEEAWKCRVCEFAEGCEWRKDKEKEMLQRGKKSRESGRKSKALSAKSNDKRKDKEEAEAEQMEQFRLGTETI